MKLNYLYGIIFFRTLKLTRTVISSSTGCRTAALGNVTIVVTGLPHSGDDTTAEYVVRSFVVNAAIRNYLDESLVTKVPALLSFGGFRLPVGEYEI